MSKLKKNILVSMVLLLLVVSFSGCAPKKVATGSESETIGDFELGEDGNGPDGNIKSENVTSENVTSENVISGNNNNTAAINLKGREISIAIVDPSVFLDKNQYMYKSLRDTEKRFNCKFKIIKIDAYNLNDELKKAHLSGTAFADAVSVPGYSIIPGSYKSGMFLELSKYTKFTDANWSSQEYKNSGVVNEKRYAMPYMLSSPSGLIYNKKILQAVGIDDPWKYVDKNTWNLETFYDISKKIKQNNYFPNNSEFYDLSFIIANGGQILDNTTVKTKFVASNEKAISMFEKAKKFKDDGLMMTPEDLTSLSKDSFSAFTSGKIAFMEYGMSYVGWLVGTKAFKASEIGWVWFPKGPNAKDYYVQSQDIDGLLVPLHVKEPEKLVPALKDAFEYWRSDKTSPTALSQVRNENLKFDYFIDFFTNANNMKFYTQAPSKIVFPRITNYNDALSGYYEMISKIKTGQMQPRQAVDSYKDKIQAALDDYNK